VSARLKSAIATLLLLVTLSAPLAPVLAASNLFSQCESRSDGTKVCGPCSDNSASGSPVCQGQNNNQNPIVNSISTAASVLAIFTGIGAVIMIVIGGLTMVTSAGNSENVAKARRRVIYSVVGLVVVALAWSIVHFVIVKLIQ
jgi:hypothetical protein